MKKEEIWSEIIKERDDYISTGKINNKCFCCKSEIKLSDGCVQYPDFDLEDGFLNNGYYIIKICANCSMNNHPYINYVVDFFKNFINKELIKERDDYRISIKNIHHNCICCDKEIPKLDGMIGDKDWEGMWGDGVVDKINANYGSCFDGDMYVIAICDKCIEIKKRTEVLKYVGNYMFPENYPGIIK